MEHVYICRNIFFNLIWKQLTKIQWNLIVDSPKLGWYWKITWNSRMGNVIVNKAACTMYFSQLTEFPEILQIYSQTSTTGDSVPRDYMTHKTFNVRSFLSMSARLHGLKLLPVFVKCSLRIYFRLVYYYHLLIIPIGCLFCCDQNLPKNL